MNKRGFTLLEALMAVALSSLLMLAVYVTYFSVNRSIEAASEEQDVLETGRILIELIKQDLRGITLSGDASFIGKLVKKEGDEPVSKLDFVTSSSMGQNPFGYSEVGYYLIKDLTDKYVMIRREAKEVKGDPTEGGVFYELTQMVTSFKLSYYDGFDWQEEWDSKALGKLPKQVRIFIKVKDEKGNSKEFTTDETIPSAI
ncbi:MAG TPA: type II secretion system protein GspJ [Syntrophorhabdaceae bacterium]|nr:prepilin-type N-terminal cleavage/methylation domain-containing protein [Syntrophorhabdaceae bacterium]MDI9560208.1 type II secretion system protein GspJ [Pseudomonadota bacterium]HNZ58064.1 type II secretion system protein GspJ [Syntrophorhabdaceae bacterium]HOF56787.1 type II secretion system protein GspJ [Syntrophorhabdaceae bacterium]HOS04608.1 type II secretion system protein GspJ [Syntrophorhabdaceae bacterium]